MEITTTTTTTPITPITPITTPKTKELLLGVLNKANHPTFSSKKQFQKKFVAQHKDIRSKDKDKTRSLIAIEGFLKDGVMSNALPINTGHDMTKIMDFCEQAWGNKKGNYVYLLTKDDVFDGKYGYKTKKGIKPLSIVIEYDGQSSYEAYKNQFSS